MQPPAGSTMPGCGTAGPGLDRSGNGNGFAVTNVAAGSLIGDAGLFNGIDAAGEMASCAWLEALELTACTLQAWVATDAAAIGQNRGVFVAGPRLGRGSEQSLALYQRASNATGSVVENWFFNVSTGNGTGAATSRAGSSARRIGRRRCRS